ncbi:MAG TPA: diacylglycerol kinase family lipid kinase [Candidatus Aphodovivens excrementavium]|nr:diacylglycerol kinase family lipid kinase [Candidatus Aphodovivens excrementavium]
MLLIANPSSCHGEGAAMAQQARRLLDGRADDALQVEFTQRPGHARQLASSAAARHSIVVVLGGDGTVHEVVNGLLALPEGQRPALGVIPAGSGNDYAFSLGMSPRLEESASQVLAAPQRWVDVGLCNGEFFAETLSFGLDAAIALDTIERRKRTGKSGTALYMQSGIDQLLHHLDFHRMEATFDGAARVEDIVLCAVQVGPTYGGGFRICPDARFDDGKLDICIAHAPVGALKAGYVFLRAKNGHHTHYREIELFRACEAHLVFECPLPVQIDGERLTEVEYRISLIPRALRVVAPQASVFSR